MLFHYPDFMSTAVFCLFSLVMVCLISRELFKAKVSTLLIMAFYCVIAVFFLISCTDFIKQSFLPTGPLLMLLMFLYCAVFVCSDSASRLINNVSYKKLISFQAFRFPLEILLHHWAIIGTIPLTMTWTGQNIDVLAGISALVFLFIKRANKTTVLVFNIFGFLLLLNVLRVVVLSSPFPFSWKLENPLLLVAYAPYSLIVPVFVMSALIGHLLVFKKLKARSLPMTK